jgi:hypothetical protein
MADQSNPTNFTHPQNFHAPSADSYPVTKTVLDMYSKTQRTISIPDAATASTGRIPQGVPGAGDLFHE